MVCFNKNPQSFLQSVCSIFIFNLVLLCGVKYAKPQELLGTEGVFWPKLPKAAMNGVLSKNNQCLLQSRCLN